MDDPSRAAEERHNSLPPPAYELTQDELDDKVSRVLEASAAADDDGFEIWEEAAFDAAAASSSATGASGNAHATSVSARPTSESRRTSYLWEKVPTQEAARIIPSAHVKVRRTPVRYNTSELSAQPSCAPPPTPPESSAHTFSLEETSRQSLQREITPPPEFTAVGPPSFDGPSYEGLVVSYSAGDSRHTSPLSSPPLPPDYLCSPTIFAESTLSCVPTSSHRSHSLMPETIHLAGRGPLASGSILEWHIAIIHHQSLRKTTFPSEAFKWARFTSQSSLFIKRLVLTRAM